MKLIFTTCLALLCALLTFAHDGDILKISDLQIDAHCDHVEIQFDIENTNELLLKDVTVEIQDGERTIAEKKYPIFSSNKVTRAYMVLNENLFNGVDLRNLHISVTEIFGLERDWGGWHGPEPSVAQYDDIGDFEIYGDAPWRMSINDDDGNAQDVPIHMVAHYGIDAILSKLLLESIDIYVKKHTEDEFGEALNYSNLSASDFMELITTESPDSFDIGIQSFQLSEPVNDSEHTISFREKYNENNNFYYTNINTRFWFFTLMMPAEELSDFADDDYLDIQVKFNMRTNNWQPYSRSSYLRVFRSRSKMPRLPGYYRGDTHVHTIYSQSLIEHGSPIGGVKEAGIAIGADWLTLTDHTSDYDNWKDGSIQKAWARIGAEVETLNAEDNSLVLIRAQEVSLNNSQNQLVHFLAYPGADDPMNMPYYGGNGGGDQSNLPSANAKGTLIKLGEINGFCYSAHPFATDDKLPAIGGLWNVGHRDFPVNGQPYEEAGGQVFCNKPGQPSDLFDEDDDLKVVQDQLKGGQVWGVRGNLIGDEGVNAYDPFNISGDYDVSFEKLDESSNSHHMFRFRQGEEVVKFVNKKALEAKNENDEVTNFKYFLSAGTDAHGSFNYSTTPVFSTVFDENGAGVNSYSLANITNVVYCPDGMGERGEHVLRGMQHGNFSISSGPILINGISTNGPDNVTEIIMGEDGEIDVEDAADVHFNLQYITSNEFGVPQYIKVIIGRETGETSFVIEDLEPLESTIILPIDELFEEAGMTLPENEFFYLRAELQTLAEYGENSPRVLEEEKFHAFTNPVWFRVNNNPVNTSINLFEEFGVAVYPNPAHQTIYIQSDRKLKHVSLYSIKGALVKQFKRLNDQLDVSEIASGEYILQAEVEGQLISKQVTIIHP